MYKLDLETAEEPGIKWPTSIGSWKKQGDFRKPSTSASLSMLKPLTVWITTNHGKFLIRWEYWTTLPASWETCMPVNKQVRNRHGTMDWFQIGKGVCQGCILLPCLINLYAEYIMRNARLDESQAGMKTARRKISKLRYADDTTIMAEREEKLDEGERREWKNWLKTQHSKN